MPDNGNYLAAAYVIAGVIILGYAMVLWRGSRK